MDSTGEVVGGAGIILTGNECGGQGCGVRVVVYLVEQDELPAVALLLILILPFPVPHALRESMETAGLVTTAGREEPIHLQDSPVAPIAQLGGIIKEDMD